MDGYYLRERYSSIKSEKPIKPPLLKPGAGIGIIAPAGPVKAHELDPGIQYLRSKGYTVILGKHLYEQEGYLAGNDEARIEDLHRMVLNLEVGAVFCARGGYGCMRLLERIDFELFRKHPKPFIGYSDITALLLALYHKSGWITFHGPMVKDLASGHQGDMDTLLDMLGSPAPWNLSLEGCRIIKPGRARGPLIGGNLSLLCHMAGTEYMPELRGCILFIEDRGEMPYRLDRMLTSLKLSGQLQEVAAIVAGEFVSCGRKEDIDRMLEDITSLMDIPVISGAPIGHGKRNIPFPIGLDAVLDTSQFLLQSSEAPITNETD
ncbi:MAG: LD-carboxypeptidase [Deltaproteobacteria bacterium]|nr:LD-carboxypeptidase [Deltaproteobacteria bacterium]MBW1929208.1 LD-carboxypeptidase [Deltaproteobacteria bacterium]MBW2125902.1 LD-carboxypeptidase [Deltaproteobacteria bacterium]